MKKKLLSILLTILMFLLSITTISAQSEDNDCITFSSSDSFTLKSSYDGKTWDGILEYSTNKINWTEWDGKEISASQDPTTNAYNLYLRGDNNKIITKNDIRNYQWVLTPASNNKISCSGNIETLRGATGNNPASTTMDGGCYRYMFSGCTSLTSAPSLPATNLGTSCYESMFRGCTSLTSAPSLPATTLTNNCYSDMFYGCTSLINAPSSLPAETLAGNCYKRMFEGCTSLINVPSSLPAETLAGNCYREMFYGCTSLINAPELPATNLSPYCYSYMFNGCTSLINAPSSLPALTTYEECYLCMFYGCTSLINAPELPATTLASDCYYKMFCGCTSLTSAPSLPATTLANSCYESMFGGCTSLTSAPSLPATTLASDCYFNMFNGCTSLVNIPTLQVSELNTYCYSNMFYGCTSLKINSDNTEGGEEFILTNSGNTSPENWNENMFTNTSGNLTGNPKLNTKYYNAAVNITLTPDSNNVDVIYSVGGTLKYNITTTNLPTTTDAYVFKVYNSNNVEQTTFTTSLNNNVLTVTVPASAAFDTYTIKTTKGKVYGVDVSFALAKKELTATTVVEDKYFDNTTKAYVTASNLTGIVNNDTVLIDAVSGEYDTKEVGTNKDVTVKYTLTGTDASKYLIKDKTVKAAIKEIDLGLDQNNESNNIKGASVDPTNIKNVFKTFITYNEGQVDHSTKYPKPTKFEVKVDNNPSGDTYDNDIKEILKVAKGKKYQGYKSSVELTYGEGQTPSTEEIKDTKGLIKIIYDFNYNDRLDIQLFRVHNGVVEELTTTPNSNGEYIEFDKENNKLIVWAKFYSTYAITYNNYVAPFNYKIVKTGVDK